jgi:type I restriction enzyme S subunit
MGTLMPYPAYKDSGVPWLGDVPEHWDMRRLQNSIQGCINGIWGSEPNGHDDLPCIRVADFDRQRLRVRVAKPTMRAIASNERQQRMLKRGDLLLEKSGGGDNQPVGVVMLYDHDGPAVCSNFVARMPVSVGYEPAYLTYLHSHLYAIRLNVRSIKQTTGIQNLDSSSYLNETVAFPPLAEQTAVVRYLDYVDRRVQRYIQARQKLIKLLEEQKQTIIHQAVTRGLDPHVPLKPSGLDWLGDIPAHWKVLAIKRVLRQLIDCEHKTAPAVDKSDYRVVRTTAIRNGRLRWEGTYYTTEVAFDAWTQRGYPEPNDVIFTREAPAGEACLVPEGQAVCLGQRTVLMKLRTNEYDPQFLVHMIYGGPPRNLIHVASQGSTVGHFNMDDIARMPVLKPPLIEQQEIVKFIEEKTQDIDATLIRTELEISLLREYRTRLIADVVTGKVDVRAIAAALPAETAEPDPPDEDNDLNGDGLDEAFDLADEAETNDA